MRLKYFFLIFTIPFLALCVLFLPFRLEIKTESVYGNKAVPKAEVTAISEAMDYHPSANVIEKNGTLYANWLYLSASVPVTRIGVKELTAEYSIPIYEGSIPNKNGFFVKAVFEDNTAEKLEVFTVKDELKEIHEETTYTIATEYGEVKAVVKPLMIDHIRAVYPEEVDYGTHFRDNPLLVFKVYEDGTEEQTVNYSTDAPDVFTEDTDINITCGNHSYKCSVSVVRVDSVEAVSRTRKTGEAPEFTNIILTYTNGNTKEVDVTDVVFREDLSLPMKEGENTYHIEYNGMIFPVTVNARSLSFAEEAALTFSQEAEMADYTHISDTIFVTVTRHELEDAFYYLTHVVINSPSQLCSGLSYGDYGGERELPTDAAKRLNWVVGTNGSNFNYGTGAPEYAGVCIKNRQVMEGTRTNGMEICLMSNGVLFSPDAGVDPERLIASGVTDSWSCGDTLLIDNGQAVNVGIQSQQYRYPRTAVGMVQPCEYYLITAGSGNYKGGMTYDEVRNVLMLRGCSFGKCMDGGGSSALILDGELINNPAVNDSERAVADFLYFVE